MMSAMMLVSGCVLVLGAGADAKVGPYTPVGFPVAAQFSPVPSGEGWKSKEDPLTPELIAQTLDNYLAHGFRGIELPTHRSPAEEALILAAAVERSMFFSYHAGALEGFGRDEPPTPCIYSAEYKEAVASRVEEAMKTLVDVPNLYNVFTYQDEPFHAGVKSFCLCPDCRERFRSTHGWTLPEDVTTLKATPARWREYLDFATMNFPDAWRRVYDELKRRGAPFVITMTHDSHNTFGGGAGSHCEVAVDDIQRWGGQFADLFVFDIYPYINFDFRFGVPSRFGETPRMSQFHYSFSQMRHLTYGANKKLGFWVGTYSPTWFEPFFNEERRLAHHFEAETAFTAVAHGADYLLTGYEIPVDAAHWETLGRAMNTLQKAPGLTATRRTPAKAAMLFPRANYLMTQREYFNVGISFELVLRAFGECDILHEDELIAKGPGDYAAIALFDCEYLSRKAADRLAAFTESGGFLLADCVPALDENGEAMDTLLKVFGVSSSPTNRLPQSGHYVPYADREPQWPFRDPAWVEPDYATEDTVVSPGDAATPLPLVSVRRFTPSGADVILSTQSGAPAISRRVTGKGTAVLFGFCMQDTWFAAWMHKAPQDVAALEKIVADRFAEAGIQPGVYSDNTSIEAALRVGKDAAFLFAINHEAVSTQTRIAVRVLPFAPGAMTDVAMGESVPFEVGDDGVVTLGLNVELDNPRLIKVIPQ